MRRYWKSHYLWDLPDTAIDAFLGRGAASSGGGAPVTGSLQARGGAIARIGEQDAAAGHRGARFEFMASTSWTSPGEDDTRRTSTRLYADQIAPYGRGVYVNNLGIEGEDRVRDAYGAEKFQRLTSLKRPLRPRQRVPPQSEHPPRHHPHRPAPLTSTNQPRPPWTG